MRTQALLVEETREILELKNLIYATFGFRQNRVFRAMKAKVIEIRWHGTG